MRLVRVSLGVHVYDKRLGKNVKTSQNSQKGIFVLTEM